MGIILMTTTTMMMVMMNIEVGLYVRTVLAYSTIRHSRALHEKEN
jgi:hypothetical protein